MSSYWVELLLCLPDSSSKSKDKDFPGHNQCTIIDIHKCEREINIRKESRHEIRQTKCKMHDTNVKNCQIHFFFFKKENLQHEKYWVAH